jgi:hypothetical protein
MIFLLLILASGSVWHLHAQDEAPPDTGVWVTTQDFSSLRAGPSTAFERLAVVDPEVTLPAIGRTSNVQWVQVVYDDEPGWIFAPLLVWSGDIITLPVDGVATTPFIRRATATGFTTRETPIYPDGVQPGTEALVLPAGTGVELTGRLGGDTRFFQFQILYEGRLYWVGSWNIRVVEGNYTRLLDVTYAYPYGRLVATLEANIADVLGKYQQINRVWLDLTRGESVSCGLDFTLAARDLPEAEVARDALFQPPVRALDNAIASTNRAISIFEDVCGRESRFVERAEVDEALTLLRDAERNLLLAGSLLEPLRDRNPLLRILRGE